MEQLKQLLRQIDGKGYSSYQRLRGEYRFPDYKLMIDHVQKDPFASPTKIRIVIPLAKLKLEKEHYHLRMRKIYCEDLIARRIARLLKKRKRSRCSRLSPPTRPPRPTSSRACGCRIWRGRIWRRGNGRG